MKRSFAFQESISCAALTIVELTSRVPANLKDACKSGISQFLGLQEPIRVRSRFKWADSRQHLTFIFFVVVRMSLGVLAAF